MTYITFLTYVQSLQACVCELPVTVLLKTDTVLFVKNIYYNLLVKALHSIPHPSSFLKCVITMLSLTKIITVVDGWMNEYVPLVEILRGDSGNAWRKTCYSATWSTKILTWTELGPKVGLHVERLVTA